MFYTVMYVILSDSIDVKCAFDNPYKIGFKKIFHLFSFPVYVYCTLVILFIIVEINVFRAQQNPRYVFIPI